MRIINFFLLYVLTYTCCISCQSPSRNKDTNNLLQTSQKVIDITCDACVLYIRPTEGQIDLIKANYQSDEHFYTMIDDASFYSINAIEYLQNKNINIFYLDTIKTVCFNKKDTLDFSNLAWDFVLYKKNKMPQIVKAIDLVYEFELYFDINKFSVQSENPNDWNNVNESIGITSDDPGDLDMTGWSKDCDSNFLVYFNVAGAQFHFSTNYTMNTLLKKCDAITYAVYFSYPIVRPIPENMQNCRDYAENIPIAKIEKIDDELRFTWFGFYDVKKEIRIHTQNPFDENQQSILLKKCDR